MHWHYCRPTTSQPIAVNLKTGCLTKNKNTPQCGVFLFVELNDLKIENILVMTVTSPSMRKAFTGLLIAIFVTTLYWNGFYGEFFFDDEVNILLLEGIQLTELSLHSAYDAMTSGIAGPTGRPIAQLSFALNHYFSGFDPFAFKATNLAIHLATGLLVYLVARHLLASTVFAGFAAMLWLVHPIQLTSILYVVQRMTSLATLFLLAGFYLHMIGREHTGRKGTVLLLLAWLFCWPLS